MESPQGGSGAHREFPKEAPLVAQPLPWAFLGLCLLKLPKEMTPLQAMATAKFSRHRGAGTLIPSAHAGFSGRCTGVLHWLFGCRYEEEGKSIREEERKDSSLAALLV